MINIHNWTANEDDPRDYLRKPFELEGRLVATNGSAIISTELKGAKLPNAQEHIAKTLKKYFKQLQNSELTKVDLHQCETGEFALERDCKECDGEGELTFENAFNDYEVECKSCRGDGKNLETNKYVVICGLHFSLEFVDLLYYLNNLKVVALEDKLGFEADEGSGFVMSIRKVTEA